jgi:DNA uptake protein ComE-like DNA-binding protein
MDKNIVRWIPTLLLALACATGSSAQEAAAPTPKKPMPKAAQEAKAKAREKKIEARTKADAEAKANAVDINHASMAELKKIPGITDSYAAAIITKRPYKSKADLVEKKAIPMGLFQSIRKLVAAK